MLSICLPPLKSVAVPFLKNFIVGKPWTPCLFDIASCLWRPTCHHNIGVVFNLSAAAAFRLQALQWPHQGINSTKTNSLSSMVDLNVSEFKTTTLVSSTTSSHPLGVFCRFACLDVVIDYIKSFLRNFVFVCMF